MKRRGLLLDRDGVVNVDHHYIGRPEKFEFIPGIFPFLRTVQDIGFRLAIVTNQSGVARELFTPEDFKKVTSYMRGELAKEGIAIDLVLACFEHEDGAAAGYNRQSFWRKPNPGMVLEAVQRMQLDPTRSATCSAIISAICKLQRLAASAYACCLPNMPRKSHRA